MNRNEYRRAFIMLRAVEQGYGGHARLERRTLSGSLYFVVTAPQGVELLTAMLAGQRDGQYFATPVGALTRDRRGQLTLAWQFDPRNIDGRPLEAYHWVTILANGRAIVLTGNLEGSRPLDLAALRRAATRLAEAGDAPAADLPAPEEFIPANADADPYVPPEAPAASELPPEPEVAPGDAQADDASPAPVQPADAQGASAAQADLTPQAQPDAAACPRPAQPGPTAPSESGAGQGDATVQGDAAGQAQADAGNPPRPTQADADAPADDHCDVKIYTRARYRSARLSASSTDASASTPSEPPAEALAESAAPRPAGKGAAGGEALAQPRQSQPSPIPQPWIAIRSDGGAGSAPEAQPALVVQTAARMLGLDITSPWPPAAEPLRRLFATLAPAESAPEDGFVYVAAPMPAASGYDACLVGMKAAEGRPTALRYALPARYAPEPPAGLEAYRWTDLGNGDGAWVLDVEII